VHQTVTTVRDALEVVANMQIGLPDLVVAKILEFEQPDLWWPQIPENWMVVDDGDVSM
jgi:hypothetical protein